MTSNTNACNRHAPATIEANGIMNTNLNPKCVSIKPPHFYEPGKRAWYCLSYMYLYAIRPSKPHNALTGSLWVLLLILLLLLHIHVSNLWWFACIVAINCPLIADVALIRDHPASSTLYVCDAPDMILPHDIIVTWITLSYWPCLTCGCVNPW